MQKRIKSLVYDLDIDYKRDLVSENKTKIFDKEREMSKLTFDINVGRYAFNLDEYFYYLDMLKKIKDGKRKEKVAKKLDEIYHELMKTPNDKGIEKYKKLRDEISLLKDEYRDYYKTINIDFRECLSGLYCPEIFVFQGDITSDLKYYRNIVDSNQFYGCYGQLDEIIIYPNSELNSHRDYKHFYNKISFKYLEDVSKNLDFDLDKKYNLVRRIK